MAITLNDLRDNDGLVPLIHVKTNPAFTREMCLVASGQRVYVNPIVFAVSDFIVRRHDLVPLSRLMLIEAPQGRKGVGLFGVCFERALDLAAHARAGVIQRSLFKVKEGLESVDYDLCTTLLAHVQKKPEGIQLEVWQRLESSSETFYVHGLLDDDLSSFKHLDGATMHHSSDEARQLFVDGDKVKGVGYQKWFRLDGKVHVVDAMDIAMAFLPCHELVKEYIDRQEESIAPT